MVFEFDVGLVGGCIEYGDRRRWVFCVVRGPLMFASSSMYVMSERGLGGHGPPW